MSIIEDDVLIITMQSENTSSDLCSFHLATKVYFLFYPTITWSMSGQVSAAVERSKITIKIIKCVTETRQFKKTRDKTLKLDATQSTRIWTYF